MCAIPPSAVLDLINDTSLEFGGAWGGMLFFDALVFILTVYKAFTLRRRSSLSLFALILRDGELYIHLAC